MSGCRRKQINAIILRTPIPLPDSDYRLRIRNFLRHRGDLTALIAEIGFGGLISFPHLLQNIVCSSFLRLIFCFIDCGGLVTSPTSFDWGLIRPIVSGLPLPMMGSI